MEHTFYRSCPTSAVTSQDLGKRYSLGKHRLTQIRAEMMKHSVAKDDTFRITLDGFEALLRYQILTCIAVWRPQLKKRRYETLTVTINIYRV